MATIRMIRWAYKQGVVVNWKLPRLLKTTASRTSVAYKYKIHGVWRYLFKSYDWLEKVSKDGNPPVLVGSVLQNSFPEKVARGPTGHLLIICVGETYPKLFKDCLQPHKLHTHGKVYRHDYAFQHHNITLNAHCVMTGTTAHTIYTRWPEKLSEANALGRHSAYLVWGEKTERKTQAVYGMEGNSESTESVSRICKIKLPGYQGSREFQICKEYDLLFAYDVSQSCYKYAEDYKSTYIAYKEEIDSRKDAECSACIMKGDARGDMV